jgi:hypothetical protein
MIIRNRSPIVISAKETIKLNLPSRNILIIEVLLVPELYILLLSVSELTVFLVIIFFEDHCFVAEQSIVIYQDILYCFKETVNYKKSTLSLPISIYIFTFISIYAFLSAKYRLAALPLIH